MVQLLRRPRVCVSRLARWTLQIDARSARVGRSTKKISSKRPLRSSSGGSPSMSFAVAMTKTGLGLLLHPGEEGAEDAGRGARVARRRPLAKPFSISSIHRTHGSDRLGGADRGAHVLLARSDEPGEDPADVEPQQRQPPGRGDGLGGQRLAAAGDAGDQHAARRREPVLRCLGQPGAVPLGQPPLQVLQATDIGQVDVAVDELQQPRLAHGLPLLLVHHRDVVKVEHAVVDHRAGEGVLRLLQREAEGGLGQPLPACISPGRCGSGHRLSWPRSSRRAPCGSRTRWGAESRRS